MIRFFFVFGLFLIVQPSLTWAAVQVGAGHMKTYKSAFPTPAELREDEDIEAMEKAVAAKKELVPLAENVAHMFRPELEDLRNSLVNRALNRLPPDARAEQREVFEAYIDIDQILGLYSQTLITYFTKEELKALRTFMAEENGRQVLNKLPEVLTQMRLKRQKYLQNTLQNILQKEVIDPVKKGEGSLLAP